jgi:hypothetical protein
MVQSAYHRLGNDPTMLKRFHRTWLGSIVTQSHMWPRLVIIVQVSGQNLSQMPLVADDDMVQTLAADGADHSLHVRRLPGRAWGRHDFLAMQAGQAAPHLTAVDAIAVADQVTRRRLERKSLPQLPADPRLRRCHRDGDVHHAALVAEND